MVNLINLINVKLRIVYQTKYSYCQLQKRTFLETKRFKYNAQKQLRPWEKKGDEGLQLNW